MKKWISASVVWASAVVGTKGFATLFSGIVLAVAVTAIALLNDKTVPNVTAIVQAAVVVIGLLSLVLIARQIRTSAAQGAENSARLRALAYHEYFGDLITVEIRQKLAEVADKCDFKDARKNSEPMAPESVLAIKAAPECDSVIATYLDEFEEFCAAIHAGLLDEDYAYGLEATRIIRAWVVFGPYIEATRLETADHRTYVELEMIGLSWTERRLHEDATAASTAAEAQRRRSAKFGVQNRIPVADKVH